MKEIKSAIEIQQKLLILYKGIPRVIEPYIVGTNASGKIFLRAYQIGGESCTDEIGFKLFEVGKVQAVTVIPNLFFAKPKHGYKKIDPVITTVYARV
ncbi:hypothetical protein H8K47_17135 [Undibacterium sp. CY7W]|uniref:Uncharacterized protein n=1 Tax=Undibacterium rugosum TaxID=2762291 RepID=A0A923L022_9BURK|nr:hypothetical protein [Undibacterium rugosum]MBC3937083.1 hypothetical protein [Undibacterium rugosum]